MSNLLDKSSIVLTPTAYDNGKVLCVKPSDGSGDMDFSRNSAATRVNAQGLVEDVQILSSNLVQNGDFSEQGSELGNTGIITNNNGGIITQIVGISYNATSDGTSSASTRPRLNDFNITDGKFYKLTITPTNQSGDIKFTVNNDGSNLVVANDLSTGLEFYFLNGSNFRMFFDGRDTFNCDFEISLKEIGQNWVIENTWTIGDGVANGNGANGSTAELKQTSVNTIGKSYKATFKVLNYVSGSVGFFRGSGIALTPRDANGVYTEYFEATSSEIRFRGINFNGSVTNISVIEITDDTNLPRINYDGFSFDGSGNIISDSGCGSWLFEPQSTNLITYSEDFSQWQRVNIATEVSTTLSPDGISFMTKATFSASASNSYIRQNKTMAVGSVTSSIFVKKGDLDAFALIRIGSIDNPVSVWFNLDNGTVANSTGSPTNTSIVNYGNGVYRISATTTSATDLTLTSIIQSSDTSTGNPTENATQFYWGGQIEILPYATSYIPTDGTSVTRNQDDCTNGGSAASINSTSGVLYAEISALANENSQRVLSISDGTHNNCVKLGILNSATAYKIFANIRLAGVNQAFLAADFGAVAPTFKKCAIKYKENDFALWIDGVEVATDTSGNTFSENTLNSLQFDRGNGIQDFYGKTKCLAVFPFLTDTELQELTTI